MTIARLVLPERFTLRVYRVDAIDWTIQSLEVGAGAVFDLTGEAGEDVYQDPVLPWDNACWGERGDDAAAGSSGGAGGAATSARFVIGAMATRGSLWIRSDGGSGGAGEYGGAGAPGGDCVCAGPQTCHYNPRTYERCVSAGRGGSGGDGGDGGDGGRAGAVSIRWARGTAPVTVVGTSTCGPDCGPGSAPPGFPSDDGRITVSTRPGCGGAPGLGGPAGRGGRCEIRCGAECAVAPGEPGTPGRTGRPGALGGCGP
jgi:hypothetical protein